MLIAAVGDRPIGIQASQVAAAARWAAARYSDGPVLLVVAWADHGRRWL